MVSLAFTIEHELCARRCRKGNPVRKAREGRLAAIAWLTTAVWVAGFALGVAVVLNEFFRGDISSSSLGRISPVNFAIQAAEVGLCGAAMSVLQPPGFTTCSLLKLTTVKSFLTNSPVQSPACRKSVLCLLRWYLHPARGHRVPRS